LDIAANFLFLVGLFLRGKSFGTFRGDLFSKDSLVRANMGRSYIYSLTVKNNI